MRQSSRRLVLAILLIVVRRSARAEEPDVAEARQHFVVGLEHVKEAHWAEALTEFERSLALRPHAVTRFNIGACERALGRYTRARATLRSAIAMTADPTSALPPSLVEEARGLVAEIERVLVHLAVRIEPPEAALAVDGRPVERIAIAPAVFVAGTLPPGKGAAPEARTFELELDPGAHLLTLSRKGYTDVLVNRTFAPGTRAPLSLELDRLPATLHVESTRSEAIVAVNDVDVGAAPVSISRPAGSYRVRVTHPGFVTYLAQLTLQPGEDVSLRAPLEPRRPSVFRRWWFWTASAAAVAVVGVGAFLIARAANPPQPDGGGLQWVVDVR